MTKVRALTAYLIGLKEHSPLVEQKLLIREDSQDCVEEEVLECFFRWESFPTVNIYHGFVYFEVLVFSEGVTN